MLVTGPSSPPAVAEKRIPFRYLGAKVSQHLKKKRSPGIGSTEGQGVIEGASQVALGPEVGVEARVGGYEVSLGAGAEEMAPGAAGHACPPGR